MPEDLRSALPNIHRAIAWAPIVAAEVDATGQAHRLEQATEFVLIPALAELLLGDERGSFIALGLALLARESLLRSEQLDGLSVDRIVQPDRPEHCLAFLLAARPELGGQRLELLAVVGEMEMEHHVAIDDVASVDGEPGLERLRVEQRV